MQVQPTHIAKVEREGARVQQGNGRPDHDLASLIGTFGIMSHGLRRLDTTADLRRLEMALSKNKTSVCRRRWRDPHLQRRPDTCTTLKESRWPLTKVRRSPINRSR